MAIDVKGLIKNPNLLALHITAANEAQILMYKKQFANYIASSNESQDNQMIQDAKNIVIAIDKYLSDNTVDFLTYYNNAAGKEISSTTTEVIEPPQQEIQPPIKHEEQASATGDDFLRDTSDNLIERTYQKRAKIAKQDVKDFVSRLKETVPLDTSAETVKRSFKGMEQAVKAIDDAILSKQKIFIYGDYDVDGITSATIAENSINRRVQVLRQQGHDISFNDKDIVVHLPQRSEGYGINEESLKSLVGQIPEGQKALMITVDTGTGTWDKLRNFADKFNYVITDHHLPENGETVESVMKDRDYIKAVLNPHYKGTYSFEHLSGAGVAFKLSQALGGGEADVDLAALGTIADMVPLEDENRGIVQKGLEVINSKEQGKGNAGIKSLWRHMQYNATVTSEGIAYYIAPAINAGGRVGEEYDKAVGITDPKKTGVYAPYNVLSGKASKDEDIKHLVEVNDVRKEKTSAAVKDIEEELKKELKEKLGYEVTDISQGLAAAGRKSIVVHKEGLAHGLIGLVAGKLQERYHVPTIVFSGEEGDIRGSARSVEGLNLKETLDKIAAVPDGPLKPNAYGGHEGAAGLSIEKDKIKDFADIFDKEVKQKLGDYTPRPWVDLRLSDDENLASLFTPDNIKSLESTAPFGQGNSRPTYQARVQISDIKHRQNNVMTFNVFSHGDKRGIPAIIFDSTHLGQKISIDQAHYNGLVDITFQAGVETKKGGKESVQLTVTDIGFLEDENVKVADEDKILPFGEIEKAKVDDKVKEAANSILENMPGFSKPLGKDIPVKDAAQALVDTVQEEGFRKELQPLVKKYEADYLAASGDKASDAAEKLKEIINEPPDYTYAAIAGEEPDKVQAYLVQEAGLKKGQYFSDDIIELFNRSIKELQDTKGLTGEELQERRFKASLAQQAYEIVSKRKFTPYKSQSYRELQDKIEKYYGEAFDTIKDEMEQNDLIYDAALETKQKEKINEGRPSDKQIEVYNSWRYNQIRGQLQSYATDHAEGIDEEISRLKDFAEYYGVPEENIKSSSGTGRPSSVRKSLKTALAAKVREEYKDQIGAIQAIEKSFNSDEDILAAVYKSPRDPGKYFQDKLESVTEEKRVLEDLYGHELTDDKSLREQLKEVRESDTSKREFLQNITKKPEFFGDTLREGTYAEDIWNYYKNQKLFKDSSGKAISFLESQEYKDLLGNYIDYILKKQEGDHSLTRKDFQWLIDKNIPANKYVDIIQEKVAAAQASEEEKRQTVENLKNLSSEDFNKAVQYPKDWVKAFVTDKDGKIQRDPKTYQWIRQPGKDGKIIYNEDFYDNIETITKNRVAWGLEEVTDKDGKKYNNLKNTYRYGNALYRTEIKGDLDILAEHSLNIQEYLSHNDIKFDISDIKNSPVEQLERFKGILASESAKNGSKITKYLEESAELGKRIRALKNMSDEDFQTAVTYNESWRKAYATDEKGNIQTDDKGRWLRTKQEDGTTDLFNDEVYNGIEDVQRNRKAWGTIKVQSADGKREFTRLKNVAYFNDKLYRINDNSKDAETDEYKRIDNAISEVFEKTEGTAYQFGYLFNHNTHAIQTLSERYNQFYSQEKGFVLSDTFSNDNIKEMSNQGFADLINSLNDFVHDTEYFYQSTTGYLKNAEEVANHLDELSFTDFNKAYTEAGLNIIHKGQTEEVHYTPEEVRKFWNRARGHRDPATGFWQNGLYKIKGQYYRGNEVPAGTIKRSNERAAQQQKPSQQQQKPSQQQQKPSQQQQKTPAEKAEKTVQQAEEIIETGSKLITAVGEGIKKGANSVVDTMVHGAAKAFGWPENSVEDNNTQTTAQNGKKTKTKIPSAKRFAFGSHMPAMLGFMGTMGAITLFDSAFHSRGNDQYEMYQKQRAEQRRRMYSGEFYG